MALVMVCDPFPETRELTERLLQRLGHSVVTNRAGQSKETVDVIVFEPGRPEEGAPRDPRKDRPGSGLVVTSIYPPSASVRSLAPAAFLLKPFSLGQLARALDAALAARRAAAA